MKELLKRFVEILKTDFLVKNFNEENTSKTWKFWFFGNSLVVIIIAFFAVFGVVRTVGSASDYLKQNYPNAKISIIDGKLSIDGINEPIYYASKDGNIFVVDTKGVKYDESVLNDFKTGVFVSATKIFNKKDSVKTEQYDISQAKTNGTITENDIQNEKVIAEIILIAMIVGFAWIYLNILRLAGGLWWALIFLILGKIMKVENIKFSKVYFSVLNFYIIPLILSLALMFFGINIPFFTFIIFLVLFIVNYVELNKNKVEPQIENEKVEE